MKQKRSCVIFATEKVLANKPTRTFCSPSIQWRLAALLAGSSSPAGLALALPKRIYIYANRIYIRYFLFRAATRFDPAGNPLRTSVYMDVADVVQKMFLSKYNAELLRYGSQQTPPDDVLEEREIADVYDGAPPPIQSIILFARLFYVHIHV